MRAEEIGLADVWVSDHLVYPADQGYPASYLFDPLLTLSWAASSTQRIGLGTSVMVVPQYHPLHLANSLASLDQLSGGRLNIGAGVGWSEAEFSALGQDFRTRGARMDEALEIMRLVWTESPASYQGKHYQFEDIKVLPQPAHPIPIWVGGSSQPGYDRAAAVGDGFQGLKQTSPRRWGRSWPVFEPSWLRAGQMPISPSPIALVGIPREWILLRFAKNEPSTPRPGLSTWFRRRGEPTPTRGSGRWSYW